MPRPVKRAVSVRMLAGGGYSYLNIQHRPYHWFHLAGSVQPTFRIPVRRRGYDEALDVQSRKDGLKYDGTIYLIAYSIYSSAGSMTSYAMKNDKIVVVGEPTGAHLGSGIDPIYFTLPNSLINIRLEPAIDLTDAESAGDTVARRGGGTRGGRLRRIYGDSGFRRRPVLGRVSFHLRSLYAAGASIVGRVIQHSASQSASRFRSSISSYPSPNARIVLSASYLTR